MIDSSEFFRGRVASAFFVVQKLVTQQNAMPQQPPLPMQCFTQHPFAQARRGANRK